MLLYVEKRFVFKRFFLSGVLINSQFYKNETYFVCGFLEWFNFSSFLRLKLLLILRKNSLYLMIMMCWLKYSSSKKLFCILKGAKTQIILLIPKVGGSILLTKCVAMTVVPLITRKNSLICWNFLKTVVDYLITLSSDPQVQEGHLDRTIE